MASKKVFAPLGASSHSTDEREKNDFYASDPISIDKLLEKIEIPKDTPIWECAAGNGHMSNRLKSLGYDVVTSDIVEREMKLDSIQNFLACNEKFNGNIVTNPPYKYAMEFVLKSLELIEENKMVAMLLKTTFLEGQNRFINLFDKFPPKKVLVFTSRIQCSKNGDFDKYESSAISYSWFIWEKGFKGKPTIEWITKTSNAKSLFDIGVKNESI